MENFCSILMYHDIELDRQELNRYSSADFLYTLTQKQFSTQLSWLKQNNFKTQLLSSIVPVDKLTQSTHKKVVITFDDGHVSNYYAAAPLLIEHGMQGVFFITTDFIGRSNMLTKKQVRELSEMGMEIGSHSKTHTFPSLLSFNELQYELTESKKRLEDIIGKEVKLFSNPSGYLHPKLPELAAQTGYNAVCLGNIGRVGLHSDPFLLPRITIKRAYSQKTFERLLHYDMRTILWYKFSESFRSRVRAVIGAEGYEKLKQCLLKNK